jgi:cytochrome c peroxidase
MGQLHDFWGEPSLCCRSFNVFGLLRSGASARRPTLKPRLHGRSFFSSVTHNQNERLMRIRGSFLVLAFVLALPVTCVADLVAMHGSPPQNPPSAPAPLPNNFPIPNDAGIAATFSEEGFVDRADEFHTPQGANGRSCATCHVPESGWSITPADIKRRFIATGGLDPLFNKLDANNPNLDLSTVMKRKQGYSMLLQGLFRRGGAVPGTRDFDVVAVDDPNGVGSTSVISFYRRPLTTANMKLMIVVQWDGRFRFPDEARPLRPQLQAQASGNIRGGQERPADDPPPPELVDAIVDEELQIWHAQLAVPGIGRLDTCGGRGGAELLSRQSFTRAPFDLFNDWTGFRPNACDWSRFGAARRAQIARGQEIFNTRLSMGDRPGTCQGCHNVQNNGTHLEGNSFDIGTSDATLRAPGMPLYTLRKRCDPTLPTCTIEEKQTTDPGRAFVTGRFADINRFKVPTLRGAVARAPYFHNGSAKTLREVVRHYSTRRNFNFTHQEEDDLVAFLNAL